MEFPNTSSHRRLNILSVRLNIYGWFDSDSIMGNTIEIINIVRIDFDTILESGL